MTDDLISIRMRLLGGRETASELGRVDRSLDGIDSTTARVGTTTAKAEKSSSRFRSTLGGLGSAIKYSAIPGLALLGYGVTSSISAYREARKIGEQTNAVIKSTGGIANVTGDEVQRLSNILSLKTGVDDEEIQSGANMLLTFRNLRNEAGKGNDIFSQSLEVVNDMSSALGRDLKSSAIQVGKALNDPAVGLTALSRAGVTFTQQQKDQITTLFASGKRLKAQKMILGELTKEFSGSAKANHDAVDRLGVAWENLEETLGKAVYPILQDVTTWLTKALRQAQHGKGPLIDLKDGFVDVGHSIKDVVDFVDAFIAPFRTAVGLMEKWRDLTHQLLLNPNEINPAFGSASDLALGIPQPGGDHGAAPPTGHPQNKVRRTPVTDAPKASTETAGSRGGKRSLIVKLVDRSGRQLAETVVDEAEIAAAWA